jgi:kelch-like protein 20
MASSVSTTSKGPRDFLQPKYTLLSRPSRRANENGALRSRYDPKENKWSKVSPMTTRRLGVAVAVLGGYLYAIGGSDGHSPLNTVERYDPRQNKWSQVSPMSTRRKHLGCAVFNNVIYAVGGRDDCMELSSAERYNPHTNSWSPIVAMTSRRSGVSRGLRYIYIYIYNVIDYIIYNCSSQFCVPLCQR